MDENNEYIIAVVKYSPVEIKNELEKIPEIHKQEAINLGLEKAILLSSNPKIENIEYLLNLGAIPTLNILEYAYNFKFYCVIELLLSVGCNADTVLEQAVRNNDLKYILRFISAGAKPTEELLQIAISQGSKEIQKILIKNFKVKNKSIYDIIQSTKETLKDTVSFAKIKNLF